MDLLVTGATGFVGGALVPRLLAAGHRVRCLVRDRTRLTASWRGDVEVVEGRVESEQAVLRAADGVEAAYFLVHGMGSSARGLVARERDAAAAFRDGADLAGVRHTVYLGGLVDEARLSTTSVHLYARQQAGVELRRGAVPVTELRAGIVLGEGSASFDLLVAAARSPVALEAPWSRSLTQPIAVDDLLALLVAVVEQPPGRHLTLDIGGPDVVTYAELVRRTRAVLGTGRGFPLHVPYLPPEAVALSAASLAGVSPSLAVGLLPSAAHDAIVRDDRLAAWYPGIVTTPLDTALAAAAGARSVSAVDAAGGGATAEAAG